MARRSAPRATYRHGSPQLVLAGTPAPEAQGTMFDVGPVAPRSSGACSTCGAPLFSGHWDRCRRCVEIGAEATTLDLAPEAHRCRCGAPLAAGHAFCSTTCETEADEAPDERRDPETMHLVSWPREANGAAWCETCGTHACAGTVAAAELIEDRTFPAWIAT